MKLKVEVIMQNDRDLVKQSIYTLLKTYNISNYKPMKHALKTKDMSQMVTITMMTMTNKCHYGKEQNALILYRLH